MTYQPRRYVLQLPRPGEPESALIPGMSTPAPRTVPQPLDAPTALSMPDTSIGPVALQEPATWSYDFDPASLQARASYPGIVNFSQDPTVNGVPIGGGGPFLALSGGTLNATPASSVPVLQANTSNNGPTCNNGLTVIQGYLGGGLAMGNGLTPHTVTVQYGAETFNQHFAKVFSTAARATGQYNNFESVLTLPAGSANTNLAGAITGSVVDYQGNGAQAGIFYATAMVNNATMWGLNTVCADSPVSNQGAFTGVFLENEIDFFVRNSSTIVRGANMVLSSNVPQGTGTSWISFVTNIFPGSTPWSVGYQSGNGCAVVGIILGTTTPGAPATIGNISQPFQFQYTDNTSGGTQRAVSIYADPTLAGTTGADLRITSSYAGRANPTLDNLAYLKSMNAAGTASVGVLAVSAQNNLVLGDAVARTIIRAANGASIGLPVAEFISPAGGINNVQFSAAAPGSPPIITAHAGQGGSDVNIGMNINTIGTGVLRLNTNASGNTLVGTGAALATTATAGHLMIPTCSGPPTGVVGAPGQAALICDSTNHKVYCNDGGGWFPLN